MDKHEALERAIQILVEETNLAAQVVTGQRTLTVAQIANVLVNNSAPTLRIPLEDAEELFQALAHVKTTSKSDARSLMNAILAAHNRRKDITGE